MTKAIDLFENYEQQPPELAVICDKWGEVQASDGLDYDTVKEFLAEVEKIGYTFDYYLDAEPYDLRKIGEEIEDNTDEILMKSAEKQYSHGE